MKGRVELYTTDKQGKNGYPVKVIVSHKNKIRRKTISHSLERQWDFKRQSPSPYHPDYEELLDRVRTIRDRTLKGSFARMEDVDSAMDYLLQHKKETPTDFLKYGYELAKQIEPTHPGNARAWRIALKELEKIEPVVYFKDLNTVFFERFKRFKRDKANSTKRAYLYAYKAIYSDAVKLGVIEDKKPFEGIFKDIKVQKRRLKNAYFEKADIKILEEATFKQRNYTIARDLALLQFYLGGLDLVDLIFIEKKHIQNGRLNIQRKKLGDKGYIFDILIPDKAEYLMNLYKGNDKKYFFDFAVDYNYPTFRVKMYRCLQQVKKCLGLQLKPMDANFTWKVMRHTFATLGKFEQIHEDILRELMGHERGDIDTVYKDLFPEKMRDEAQLKIIS
jgi:hypothetical protein